MVSIFSSLQLNQATSSITYCYWCKEYIVYFQRIQSHNLAIKKGMEKFISYQFWAPWQYILGAPSKGPYSPVSLVKTMISVKVTSLMCILHLYISGPLLDNRPKHNSWFLSLSPASVFVLSLSHPNYSRKKPRCCSWFLSFHLLPYIIHELPSLKDISTQYPLSFSTSLSHFHLPQPLSHHRLSTECNSLLDRVFYRNSSLLNTILRSHYSPI